MPPKKRLTAVEFDAVLPLLERLSSTRLEAARRALVDGETLRAIGDRFGWSRQAVSDAVVRVWQMAERYRECQRRSGAADAAPLPPGWERVTLAAPASLVARFRAEVAAEQARQTAFVSTPTRVVRHAEPS